MTDPKVERWRQIDQLCGEALLMDPEARAAFLAEACGQDAELRQEVEALIESDVAAGTFLERPALQELAQALAADVTSLVGQQIGGYHIESLLGAGGMGEVYRARDLRLEREVALKVLERAVIADAGDLRRFEDEARAASGLNHPNIVTIYGVGEAGDIAYIAMELVHGRTLRDLISGAPLPADRTIDIAAQLADALAAAHASGIVHRDLKPDNVMVTPEGLVKVLDFGIAKRHRSVEIGARRPDRPDRDPALTDAGVILGTVGYMSPEQASARAVDHRSDQFSFGAILYEVLSGRRAFERPTKAETIAAIIGEEPGPILRANARLPRALDGVVALCLSKDPPRRYPSTRDLAEQLRATREEFRRDVRGVPSRRQAIWLAAAAVTSCAAGLAAWRLWFTDPSIRRLAVLPFANPASDDDAEYLCDGLADSLIRRLSLVPGLEVKALSAVLHFKKRASDPQAIGHQLNADAVLTGSLARRGGRLIVTAELVDVARAARLWGDVFDRPEDVLAVQDELAAAIISEGLRRAVGPDVQRAFARGLTGDPRAYDLYLQAVHHFRLSGEEQYLTARDLLTQAIARDPSFALAHVTLASTYSAMAIDGYEAPHQAWPQSTLHVTRALDLDRELPDAHAEASAAEFFYRRDWTAADREWQIVLESRRAEVQPELLGFRALQKFALGQNAEALRFAQAASDADPLSASLIIREADVLAKIGQLDAAADLYDKVIREASDDLDDAYSGLAEVRRLQGRYDEAIDARRRVGQAGGDPLAIDDTVRGAAGYARLAKDDALRELAILRLRAAAGAYVSPLGYASVHARLGETERAFEFLAAAFEEKAAGLVFLRVDPSWDNIRPEPRFLDAIKRVGLPAAT